MPGLGALTLAQIETQAAQQGGNPGLLVVPLGYQETPLRTFYRAFLHHLYLNYDLPFMNTQVNITTGTGSDGFWSIDLTGIPRYRAIEVLKLDTVQNEIAQEPSFKRLWGLVYAALDNTPPPTGIPNLFSVKPARDQVWVYPLPVQVYTGKMRFWRMPDVSTSGLGPNTYPDFEDTLALIQAGEYFVRNWNKEPLANQVGAMAEKMFGQYRASVEDTGRNQPIQVRPARFVFKYQPGD